MSVPILNPKFDLKLLPYSFKNYFINSEDFFKFIRILSDKDNDKNKGNKMPLYFLSSYINILIKPIKNFNFHNLISVIPQLINKDNINKSDKIINSLTENNSVMNVLPNSLAFGASVSDNSVHRTFEEKK